MPPRGVKKGTKRARQYEHIGGSASARWAASAVSRAAGEAPQQATLGSDPFVGGARTGRGAPGLKRPSSPPIAVNEGRLALARNPPKALTPTSAAAAWRRGRPRSRRGPPRAPDPQSRW